VNNQLNENDDMPHAGQVLKPQVKLGKRPDDCWNWMGPRTNGGYGKKRFGGRDVMAHRWMWEQLFGPIPDGLVVYTTCDTRGCVNPHHLACGTQAEANRNAITTKLLPADVSDIRAAKADAGPNTARVLAARYDVTPATIHDIWAQRSWGRGRKRRPNRTNIESAQGAQTA
jgi:hypothetical protein